MRPLRCSRVPYTAPLLALDERALKSLVTVVATMVIKNSLLGFKPSRMEPSFLELQAPLAS